MAIVITEFLPNPDGADTGEWVELLNKGDSSVSLSGWHLKTGNGKETALTGTIAPHEYRVFYKKEFKFTLRNIDEHIALLDSTGRMVAEAGFSGSAQSGKSYSQTGDGAYVVTNPTPGAANEKAQALAFVQSSFPYNTPLSPSGVSHGEVIILAILLGVFLSAAALYGIKNWNEKISDLFFGRDATNRGEACRADF